jgi:hypothetical protein
MKILLLTLLLSTLFISNQANAQKTKVKIKDGIANVDGNPYLNWKKISSVKASISSLNSDEEEIAASWLNYPDPAQVSDANPKGLVRWVELYFPELDLRCEVSSASRKELVKLLIQHKIYVDGELNQENVEKLVKRYGMRFSENRPNGNVKVIINN